MGDKKLRQFSMGKRIKPGFMTLFRSRYGDNPSFLKALTPLQEEFHLESWLGRVATGIPSLEILSTPNIQNPSTFHFSLPNEVNKSTDCIGSSWVMENIQKGAIFPSDEPCCLRSVEFPTSREGVRGVSAATLLENEIELVADSEETETPVLAETFLEDGFEPVFNTEAAKPMHATTLIENKIEPVFVTKNLLEPGNAGFLQPENGDAAVFTNLDSAGCSKNNFEFHEAAGKIEKNNRLVLLRHAKLWYTKRFDNRLGERLTKNPVANKELSTLRQQTHWHSQKEKHSQICGSTGTRFPDESSGTIFANLRCNICQKFFLSKDKLLYTSHIQFHVKEARKSLYCLICEFQFKESADFLRHLVRVHMISKYHLGKPIAKQYSCDHCPKGTNKFYFITFDSLVYHVVVYHGKLPSVLLPTHGTE